MSCDDTAIFIETLRLQDMPAALAIQAQAYPAFLVEGQEAFSSRISLSASHCLAAKRGEAMLGYLLAHGWRRHSPPPLNATLADGVPSEVLFLHDLAVSRSGRGLHIGRRLVDRAFELALRDGIRSAELIAVQGAADYWRRIGFVEEPVPDGLRLKLASYGDEACWMTREISQQSPK